MRLTLIILLSVFFVNIHTSDLGMRSDYVKKQNEILRQLKIHKEYNKLYWAIRLTENPRNVTTIGKDGDYGCLQITPIRVKDYNRKTGRNYTHEQMIDSIISREIFDYYTGFIGLENHKQIAYRWNTGTSKESKAGKQYWKKVQNNYKKINES